MTRTILLLASVGLFSNMVLADIRCIQKDKLPRDKTVDAAYDFVKSVEPLVETWTPEWKYDVSKDRLVAGFEKMLKDLREVADKEENRNNSELKLLIGLSAHYAYNIDAKDSYDIAMSHFQSAADMFPNDYRSSWLIGEHLCQAASPEKGMSMLLQVEDTYPTDTLPDGFWTDYLYCSNLALTPIHGLRALRRASQAKRLGEDAASFYLDLFSKRLIPTESDEEYSSKDIWTATAQEKKVTFFNYSVGLSFRVDENWQIQLSNLKNGNAATVIELPAIDGYTKRMVPNLLIIARAVKPDESFDDFKKSIIENPEFVPASNDFCNRMHCEAYDVSGSLYPDKGGSHTFIIFMERPEPEYPGIVFEQPQELPSDDGADKPKIYRPTEKRSRMKGNIRYAIMLDSCVSIYPKAKETFDLFLKTLVIE